jgi:menaquinone-dependent protoporphyrinogen oxidase
MTKALVVYGSRHGGTKGIAERIGAVLALEGIDATVARADDVPGVDDADAFVVGSGVYMGSWLKEPIAFLQRHQALLATRPLWMFSSGPLPGSTREQPGVDPLENALGPADGPGSGGRKQVAELTAAILPREHRVFLGVFDPSDPPKAMSERLLRMMPRSDRLLPPGDFRDWYAIETWAREIARSLEPVGSRA